MKKLPIALALAAITAGSAHAVVYSTENFEGGTANYTIDHTATAGAGSITNLQSGDPLVPITGQTALVGTGYLAGSPTSMGVVASGQPTNFSPGGTIPTGQHGFFGSSGNRHMTLASPMTLLSDGAQSLTIDFSYMLYGLGTTTFVHTIEATYSALGDFTDTVKIATFATSNVTAPNPMSASILGHTTATEDNWTSGSLSIASTDVTFTDTAKIRFNKMAPSGTTQYAFIDNITVTGVIPEPTTAALLGLGGFALLLRRRK